MKFKSRVSYALGDTGINLYFMSTVTFLTYFYTEVYGLSAAAVAGLFLFARSIDAVTDPLMGYLADHTRSRWGRFRPYLIFGAIPLGLITVATFTIPNFDDTGKIIWAYVTYTLFGIIYTLVTIPYAGMTSLLTEDYGERATLSTFRMAGAFTGALIVVTCMLPLVGFFGGGAESGFAITMAILAVLSTGLIWVCFFGTKERNELVRDQERVSIENALKVLVNNPPLWIVISLFILGMLAFTFRQTTAPYYLEYVVGRPDLITPFLIVTLCIMFVGLACVPTLVKRLGKQASIQVGAVVAMLGSLGLFFNPPENVVLVFVWGCVMALGGTPIAVLGWAMIPDTVEYAQHKHGIRADGVILSTASFFQKVGKMVAGVAIPAILAFTGYVAHEVQSAASIQGIIVSVAAIPFVVNLLLLIICTTYKLDAEEHGALVDEIKQRFSKNEATRSG